MYRLVFINNRTRQRDPGLFHEDLGFVAGWKDHMEQHLTPMERVRIEYCYQDQFGSWKRQWVDNPKAFRPPGKVKPSQEDNDLAKALQAMMG